MSNILNNNSLKDALYKGFFENKEYRRALAALAVLIRRKARVAVNEATVVSDFEIAIHDFLRDIFGLDITPVKEVVTPTRTKVRGRIDSKIGAVVFEFKHHSKLVNQAQKDRAIEQVQGYLSGLSTGPSDCAKYIGIVTDGVICAIVESSTQGYETSSFQDLNKDHLDLIIKDIILSQKTALTSDNLIKDFCSDDEDSISTKLTIALYNSFISQRADRSNMLFTEWKQLFSFSHDDVSKQAAIAARKAALERIIGQPLPGVDDEYLALFALQTTYAIIIKAIAFKIVNKLRLSHIIRFSDFSSYDDVALAQLMNNLENGSIFREYGIGNLLEGDFFSWYCVEEQWTNSIAQCVRAVFDTLSRYEDKALFENGNNVIDVFKELFMSIIPEEVRHSLGEYYTPMWLADNVVRSAIEKLPQEKKQGWKGIDPCAGSGTFVVTMIRLVLSETESLPQNERLAQVLARVKGIDLNPLAVLSTRINYFINIAPLISDEEYIEIPVYLGDSSYIPEIVTVEGIKALQYSISTTQGPINVLLPAGLVNDRTAFSVAMTEIEPQIRFQDGDSITSILLNLLPADEQTILSKGLIKAFAETLVDFERRHWDGIWARIIANYLITACMNGFDLVVGNPPWVDWKSLPNAYRDRVKGLCIDNHLFSGDGITGGINLNICALITNVTANRFLDNTGILAFLMPQTILFQTSYEGFRNCYLADGSRLYIQEVVDWTKSGHPFCPVQEPFLTYFFSRKNQDYHAGIPVTFYTKKKSIRRKTNSFTSKRTYEEVSHIFDINSGVIGQVNDSSTTFSYVDNQNELSNFRLIAGETKYKGREGIEFYPQELLLFKYRGDRPRPRIGVTLENFQNPKSKYKIPRRIFVLEDTYLRPLVKGVDIEAYRYTPNEYLVPFPYDNNHTRIPIPLRELRVSSPRLARYYLENRAMIDAQTEYNEKIIGNLEGREFYALARVGQYSLGNVFVAFRDNSKWGACVIGTVQTPWGTQSLPCFQNHAVSISQYNDERYITEDEAHYLCAILNSPIVTSYIYKSSDSRSYKVRPPVYIPEYDATNPHHIALSALSRRGHANVDNDGVMEEILNQSNLEYLAICRER